MFPTLLLPALLVLAACATIQASAPGLSCKDHPANTRGKTTSVLIRAWTMPERKGSKWHDVAYIVRHRKHVYAPVSDLKSRKYRNLDLFFLSFMITYDFLPIQIFFQRPAKVYLFVDPDQASISSAGSGKTPQLDGWESEGYARLVKGRSPLMYGIHQAWERPLPSDAYVFSKLSGGSDESVTVPSSSDIVGNVKNIVIKGKTIHFWIAEKDGKPSKKIGSFKGKPIAPNARCPDKLHDEWYAYDDNKKDRDTRGVKFRTFHPAWDPCYWCAYDHEHGSSPLHLMGFKPLYDYTAFKNNRQMESQEGFKGMVGLYGKYMIYYNMHVQASKLRRMTVRFHTIELVIMNAKTRELLFHVRHKGDFGFLSARRVGKKGFLPLNKADEEKELEQGNGPRFTRAVNVIRVEDLDPDIYYRAQGTLVGAYEEWATMPVCASVPGRGALKVDIETPPTGIRSEKELDTRVLLGRVYDSKLRRNDGVNRSYRFKKFKVGGEYCNFEGEVPKGYFYTDVNGTALKPGPGPDAVRQFIKPGFKLDVTAKFETVDLWLGLHRTDVLGFLRDHGFGLDPEVN